MFFYEFFFFKSAFDFSPSTYLYNNIIYVTAVECTHMYTATNTILYKRVLLAYVYLYFGEKNWFFSFTPGNNATTVHWYPWDIGDHEEAAVRSSHIVLRPFVDRLCRYACAISAHCFLISLSLSFFFFFFGEAHLGGHPINNTIYVYTVYIRIKWWSSIVYKLCVWTVVVANKLS